MARQEMPDYLREQPAERQVAVGRPAGRRDDGIRQLFLDAGRVLMLWGWWGALAAAVFVAGENRPAAHSSCAVHAFLALVLWLLGVSLVALVPVARRFPRAARLGIAVASAVTVCFFPN